MEQKQGVTAVRSDDIVRVAEVMDRFKISEGRAYKVIRELNRELNRTGYITVAGRVPRRYFEERTYLIGRQE